MGCREERTGPFTVANKKKDIQTPKKGKRKTGFASVSNIPEWIGSCGRKKKQKG